MSPRLLDLFCGAGGAAVGYHRAGFEVVGVDIKPQPRYPFEFHQGDAMTWPLEGFDAIHASPPCQHYASGTPDSCRGDHPDLIAAVRDRLVAAGVPWVIENVMPAPLRHGVVLCGAMFGLRTYRHRRFETSWLIMNPGHPEHERRTARSRRPQAFAAGYNISITTKSAAWAGPACMGIDWMTADELGEAIPPAYTEWIGQRLMEVLQSAPQETGPA